MKETKTRRPDESWVTKCAVLSISILLMSASAINGAIPIMRDSLHISQTQVEALSTLPNLTVIIFILISSWVADRLGVKRTVTIGLIMACIGGCLPMFVSSYPLLVLARLLLGAGCGLFNSLAVSLISLLYKGTTRASLLGARNSVESLGQAILTFIAGLLLNIGWHYSFAIYIIAIPVIFIFYIFVPSENRISGKDQDEAGQNNNGSDQEAGHEEHLQPLVWFLFVLSIVLVMNNYAVTVRFPSLAAQIKGATFNSSTLLALMPILGIIAGFLFGQVHKILGESTIYLGIALFIVVNLLIGLSNGNFIVLLVGLFLSGIPCAWCFPYIYNTIGIITKSERLVNLATSIILIGCNIGGFLAPYVMKLIQTLSGGKSLAVPFPVFAVVDGLFLLALFFINRHLHRTSDILKD